MKLACGYPPNHIELLLPSYAPEYYYPPQAHTSQLDFEDSHMTKPFHSPTIIKYFTLSLPQLYQSATEHQVLHTLTITHGLHLTLMKWLTFNYITHSL